MSDESPVQLTVPQSVIDAIAERAAAIVLERADARRDAYPWLAGAKAIGAYLGWPRERVYKHLAEIPHVRHGARIMARRDELDRWLETHRERQRA